MPKLILTVAILGALFCLLWGPSFLVARRLWFRGDLAVFRSLRLLWPTQTVLVAGLVFAADAADWTNLPGYTVAITAAVGIAGAAALAAWRLLRRLMVR